VLVQRLQVEVVQTPVLSAHQMYWYPLVKERPVATDPYVLFVDDDPTIATIFTRLFQRRVPAILLIVFNSATEALALLNQHKADLVITDHTMPDMTGLAFVRKLRACGAALPIVMLSGLDYLEQEALQVGVTRFLAKHMAVTELVPTVTTILDL
jgi:CheY-like chemotaxis protein